MINNNYNFEGYDGYVEYEDIKYIEKWNTFGKVSLVLAFILVVSSSAVEIIDHIIFLPNYILPFLKMKAAVSAMAFFDIVMSFIILIVEAIWLIAIVRNRGRFTIPIVSSVIYLILNITHYIFRYIYDPVYITKPYQLVLWLIPNLIHVAIWIILLCGFNKKINKNIFKICWIICCGYTTVSTLIGIPSLFSFIGVEGFVLIFLTTLITTLVILFRVYLDVLLMLYLIFPKVYEKKEASEQSGDEP